MHIGIIGINYRSSSLQLREILTRVFQKELSHSLDNSVLLSTCNRAELYFSSPYLAQMHIDVLKRMREHLNKTFEHALYSYFGSDCFHHLGRVISGIDSAIFGESEIQRQVKHAYEQARQAKPLSHDLHYLFQKGLKIGKEMRTQVLTGKGSMQLAETMLGIVKWVSATTKNGKVLFVGNSMINRRLITFFQQKGWDRLTLCTRMQHGEFPSVPRIGWQKLETWTDYDVVVCGTYHNEYILDAKKCQKKIILFDLSVPRNIHPILGKHPSIHLYNIDELGEMAQKKREKGEKEILLCENILLDSVTKQMHLFKKRREAKWRYAAPSRSEPTYIMR